MLSVDTLIAADNAVRVIDLFVDLLDLKALGFNKTICSRKVVGRFMQRICLNFITMVI